jgi:hypothetical protein
LLFVEGGWRPQICFARKRKRRKKVGASMFSMMSGRAQ